MEIQNKALKLSLNSRLKSKCFICLLEVQFTSRPLRKILSYTEFLIFTKLLYFTKTHTTDSFLYILLALQIEVIFCLINLYTHQNVYIKHDLNKIGIPYFTRNRFTNSFIFSK